MNCAYCSESRICPECSIAWVAKQCQPKHVPFTERPRSWCPSCYDYTYYDKQGCLDCFERETESDDGTRGDYVLLELHTCPDDLARLPERDYSKILGMLEGDL